MSVYVERVLGKVTGGHRRPLAMFMRLIAAEEENVFVTQGFGPIGPHPPARGERFKRFVSRVGGVNSNLLCPPQGPGGVQVV